MRALLLTLAIFAATGTGFCFAHVLTTSRAKQRHLARLWLLAEYGWIMITLGAVTLFLQA